MQEQESETRWIGSSDFVNRLAYLCGQLKVNDDESAQLIASDRPKWRWIRSLCEVWELEASATTFLRGGDLKPIPEDLSEEIELEVGPGDWRGSPISNEAYQDLFQYRMDLNSLPPDILERFRGVADDGGWQSIGKRCSGSIAREVAAQMSFLQRIVNSLRSALENREPVEREVIDSVGKMFGPRVIRYLDRLPTGDMAPFLEEFRKALEEFPLDFHSQYDGVMEAGSWYAVGLHSKFRISGSIHQQKLFLNRVLGACLVGHDKKVSEKEMMTQFGLPNWTRKVQWDDFDEGDGRLWDDFWDEEVSF